jgi:hydroxymethylpyrimidine pyrophosphatase-like HAD family hydrolase
VKSAANVVLEETNNQDAVLRYIQRYLEETYQTTID